MKSFRYTLVGVLIGLIAGVLTSSVAATMLAALLTGAAAIIIPADQMVDGDTNGLIIQVGLLFVPVGMSVGAIVGALVDLVRYRRFSNT